MSYLPNPQVINKIACSIVVASILFAVIAQYGFHVPACDLCLYQRYTLIAIGICSFFYAFLLKNFLIFGSSFLSLFGCAVSCYHLGLEEKWWKTVLFCKSKGFYDMVIIPCDQVNWKLFGISAVFWTLLLFIFLFFIFLGIFLENMKNKVHFIKH